MISPFLCPNCGHQALTQLETDLFICGDCFNEFLIKSFPMPPLRRSVVNYVVRDLLDSVAPDEFDIPF